MAETLPFVVTRRRAVTLPVLSLKPGNPVYIRALAPMYLGEKLDAGSEADRKKEPPVIMRVVNLVTKSDAIVLVPKVAQNELHKHYPDDSYVGHCFEISTTKPPESSGKRYNLVTIAEIDDPYPDEGSQPTRPETAADATTPPAGGRKPGK